MLTRSSAVLSLPLQLGFPGCNMRERKKFTSFQKCATTDLYEGNTQSYMINSAVVLLLSGEEKIVLGPVS